MAEVIWRPDPEAAARTNVGRFMSAHGIGTFDELLARSVAEPEWFWGSVAEFLGIPFAFAFGWLAAQPVIASIIAGATKPEQVELNAKAIDWELTPQELAEIDRITGKTEPVSVV